MEVATVHVHRVPIQLRAPEGLCDDVGHTVLNLPPYMRRSPKVAEVLPILYLRGLSTGDFKEGLATLLGDDASGLSPTAITRLTAAWQED